MQKSAATLDTFGSFLQSYSRPGNSATKYLFQEKRTYPQKKDFHTEMFTTTLFVISTKQASKQQQQKPWKQLKYPSTG